MQLTHFIAYPYPWTSLFSERKTEQAIRLGLRKKGELDMTRMV